MALADPSGDGLGQPILGVPASRDDVEEQPPHRRRLEALRIRPNAVDDLRFEETQDNRIREAVRWAVEQLVRGLEGRADGERARARGAIRHGSACGCFSVDEGPHEELLRVGHAAELRGDVVERDLDAREPVLETGDRRRRDILASAEPQPNEGQQRRGADCHR